MINIKIINVKPFYWVQTIDWYQIELLVTDSNSNLTVCKQISSGSFKNNIIHKLFAYKLYIYIYRYRYNENKWKPDTYKRFSSDISFFILGNML